MIYLYAVVAGLSDLVAGWLALQGKIQKIESRYIIGFAAGVLLAVTFLDILPEVNMKADAPFLALGFLSFYVLEKVMMIHACGESECETHRIGPVAVVGMALDNFIDGAGIAVGYLIDPLLGLAITAAVVLHEVPQGITSALIMQGAQWSKTSMVVTLGLAGLLYPLGALLAGFIPGPFLQKALAFIAGDFIYIGASDLLPEAHRKFNWKVILSVVSGMAFMGVLKLLVPLV
ncbi:MAG: ZIP family metal transporter [Candidatus Methylomirabilales bacterium]